MLYEKKYYVREYIVLNKNFYTRIYNINVRINIKIVYLLLYINFNIVARPIIVFYM